MSYTLTMMLISETQAGNCGEDWKYTLEAKVFTEGLKGGGEISVPKHKLDSGEIREPFGSPEPQVIFEGDVEKELLVRLHLIATEVDMFINDVGKASKDLIIEIPHPGSSKLTKETDIAAGVQESPGILNKNSVFTLRVRFVLEHKAAV